jgi:aspartate-semialdehyde dehydrogenase
MDIFDNVVPYIAGEEDKISAEACKILGTVEEDLTGVVNQPIRISIACNRVPVLDGHTVCVSVRFTRRPPPSADQICTAMNLIVLSLVWTERLKEVMLSLLVELERILAVSSTFSLLQ